jgi:hypothetical protein
MKIYKISQEVNNDYDTYDSAVVCAENEEKARLMNPAGKWGEEYTSWAYKPEQVKVEYLGEAKEGLKEGFIVESYNAG